MNTPYQLIHADAIEGLSRLEPQSVQCVVTSPPYWCMRDYEVDGQIGFEQTPEEYTQRLVFVFREVRRVLRPDGVVWLNIGDAYAAERSGTHMPPETIAGGRNGRPGRNGRGDRGRGWLNTEGNPGASKRNPRRMASSYGLKHKDLIGLPWRVAFALQDDGWWLRADVIWQKQNPTPTNVKDRPNISHEYIFMLTASERYYYNSYAVRENLGTRNLTSVWTMPTGKCPGLHFATFPLELPETCIKASTRPGDIVLDPFCGSGTTGVAALRLDRTFIGIDLKEEYIQYAESALVGQIHERIKTLARGDI